MGGTEEEKNENIIKCLSAFASHIMVVVSHCFHGVLYYTHLAWGTNYKHNNTDNNSHSYMNKHCDYI